MEEPRRPLDEDERIASLKRLEILDTANEEAFDSIVDLARTIAGTPIAAFSLVDTNRQWFKAVSGLETRETGRDVSFCAHAVYDDDLLEVEDAAGDPRFADNPLVTNDPNIRFYAGVPVHAPDRYCVGALCVIDRQPRQIDEQTRLGLRRLAALIERELVARAESISDPVTGVFNRRFFDRRIEEEWARAIRHDRELAVILVNVDRLGEHNAQSDQEAGDAVLKRIARTVERAGRRPQDIVSRYGGNKFVAILPETPLPAAIAMGESIRTEVEAMALPAAGPAGRGILTVTVGVAARQGLADASPQGLLNAADTALFRAKASGRNRVVG